MTRNAKKTMSYVLFLVGIVSLLLMNIDHVVNWPEMTSAQFVRAVWPFMLTGAVVTMIGLAGIAVYGGFFDLPDKDTEKKKYTSMAEKRSDSQIWDARERRMNYLVANAPTSEILVRCCQKHGFKTVLYTLIQKSLQGHHDVLDYHDCTLAQGSDFDTQEDLNAFFWMLRDALSLLRGMSSYVDMLDGLMLGERPESISYDA